MVLFCYFYEIAFIDMCIYFVCPLLYYSPLYYKIMTTRQTDGLLTPIRNCYRPVPKDAGFHFIQALTPLTRRSPLKVFVRIYSESVFRSLPGIIGSGSLASARMFLPFQIILFLIQIIPLLAEFFHTLQLRSYSLPTIWLYLHIFPGQIADCIIVLFYML